MRPYPQKASTPGVLFGHDSIAASVKIRNVPSIVSSIPAEPHEEGAELEKCLHKRSVTRRVEYVPERGLACGAPIKRLRQWRSASNFGQDIAAALKHSSPQEYSAQDSRRSALRLASRSRRPLFWPPPPGSCCEPSGVVSCT